MSPFAECLVCKAILHGWFHTCMATTLPGNAYGAHLTLASKANP